MEMLINPALVDRIKRAGLILVGKGREFDPISKILEESLDLDLGTAGARKKDMVTIDGQTIARVRGKDAPVLLKTLDRDDVIALAGADSFLEFTLGEIDPLKPSKRGVLFDAVGDPMGDIVLANRSGVRDDGIVVTTTPNIVKEFNRNREWALELTEFVPGGSVEVMPRIGVGGCVADIRVSGDTLRNNGLKEVTTIMEVRPCVGWVDSEWQQNTLEFAAQAMLAWALRSKL